jgi:hypothetical protein
VLEIFVGTRRKWTDFDFSLAGTLKSFLQQTFKMELNRFLDVPRDFLFSLSGRAAAWHFG